MAKATVGLDIDINSNSVATATRRSDALTRSTDKLTSGLRGLGAGVAVAGAAITAAAGGLLVMTKRIADQADEIAKHSTRIGVTIESYQELSHAMELSGGNIGEASAALRRLSGNMLDASQGVSTAVDAFDGIGVSALTATGGLRSVDDVLADIADEFAQMEDGSEKTARAMELFGRSGATLIPLLNQGSAGIAEMRQEARDLGLVISTETAHAAEALNDDLTRLKGVATGFANAIASQLIPQLRVVVGSIEDASRSATGLQDAVADLAGNALAGFLSALRSVASLTLSVTQSFLWWKMAYEAISLSANDSGQRVDQFGNSIRNSAQETAHQIDQLEQLQNTINSLDFSNLGIEGAGRAGADAVTASVMGLTDSMFGLDDAVGPDDDTAPLRRIATQSEQAVVAIDALGSAYGAALVVANRFAIVAGKELNNAAAAQQKMLDATLNATKETKDAIGEESQNVVDQFQQLESLGTSAFSGLTSSISQLSLAAFFRKDGNALKEFGKSLGKMLVQLGTMAVVYAGVAALSAVFPALAPLVGPAAAAPALAAAGVAAIAAGAALGAATGGGGPRRGKADDENPGSVAGPSRTNIYNVQFDSFSPPRSRSRAVLESVGEAIEGGA
jgi:hypothetical protein